VELGGRERIRVEDVVAVARDGAAVAFSGEVGPRLRRAREIVDRHLARGTRVYGLTTGLGAAVDTALSSDDLTAFQKRAVGARAVAVGDRLATDEARAALFTRLAGLARGASGLSPALADALLAMVNAGIHPVAHRTGSLGEADLAPLAELMLPLAGGGEAEFEGRTMLGPAALAAAGIPVPPLGPKDGIALINASAVSVGTAALAAHDVAIALEALTLAGALSLEAFRANLCVLDEQVVALRAAPGQAEGSARLRALLAGSDLFEPGRARRLQDPLSFRCLAPVHGWATTRLRDARDAVEADLNGAGDSPAVLPEDGELLSTVGFDTTALALAFEALGQAAAHAAALGTSRIARLMSAELTGLPRFLARAGGSRTGFATGQKTASALEAEIRHLALPVGGMTAPVADGVEDYAPMTPRVVDKTRAIADRLASLAAIELVVAAEGVDQRGEIRLGVGTAAAHAFVRARVRPLLEDRPTGPDFRRIADAIAAGDLGAALRDAAP
jgi:histidine ammonia-lyase